MGPKRRFARVRIDKLLLIYDGTSPKARAEVDASGALHINGCALCQITHEGDEERPQWAACSAAIGVPVRYLHNDDMPPAVAELAQGQTPCIVAQAGDTLHLLVNSEAIARCVNGVHDLRARIVFHAARLELELPVDEAWDAADAS